MTNVSADHLGLQGIDTRRAGRREGHHRAHHAAWRLGGAQRGRPAGLGHAERPAPAWYAFSLEPDSAGVSEALARGGRAAVVRDGVLTLLRAGGRARKTAPAGRLPVTFGGLSTYNVANALAAAAATDAPGLSPAGSRLESLRSFTLDTGANPGRLNLYERRGTCSC